MNISSQNIKRPSGSSAEYPWGQRTSRGNWRLL